VSNNPRIEELRRRVESDPASIAFAQLAEEYRRGGDHEQAIEVCRTGLAQYPSYLSARVTLARALTGLGRIAEARAELERVLQVAPDNIAAKRALDDLPHNLPDPSDGGGAPGEDPALAPLEAWLDAILRDRAERTRAHASR
jgi:tetratricopeptide (TPR) repeat protein